MSTACPGLRSGGWDLEEPRSSCRGSTGFLRGCDWIMGNSQWVVPNLSSGLCFSNSHHKQYCVGGRMMVHASCLTRSPYGPVTTGTRSGDIVVVTTILVVLLVATSSITSRCTSSTTSSY